MSGPVFFQNTTVKNLPFGRKDAQSNLIPSSFSDLAFQGDYTGTNLIYRGLARTGATTSSPVWQIAFFTYDGSGNVISIQWPHNPSGNATNDYQFIWDNRLLYTYS